ncbi:FAD-dependent oxidoreductase [Haloglomus halophilum]|uniref:FAD-dependent oxidoreductase n=1 Tax=Haloglomus halophilum TaxID=2962672 RepID=UPI0020C941D3|nr:FAD-dependent oxidoreductase [Haloglomus halophilum]
MTDAAGADDTPATDRDVVVVGGGPAGTAAAVFTARYGFDTVVFDRGTSSLRQCAYLENYPGFPAGVDIDTTYDLFHDHIERVGADLVADLVTTVEPPADGGAFRVETQDGRTVRARYVVAATTYDDAYLLDCHDDFPRQYEGEDEPRFDRDHPDEYGRTAVDGLYVAGPLAGVESQVAVAVGHGARVGLGLVTDHRYEVEGLWEGPGDHRDWVVEQGRWVGEEWLENITEYHLEDVPDDLDDDEARQRAREVAETRQEWQIEADEVARRRGQGHRALAAHLDTDVLVETAVERADPETVLDALPDDAVEAYTADGAAGAAGGSVADGAADGAADGSADGASR